jgi:PAS domain S-box-containing protein
VEFAGRKGTGMTEETGGTPRHALLDHIPEMVTVSDRRGGIVYANPATERVSGYRPEEFVALDPFGQMHPEDRPRCEEAFAELLREPGLILELEHRVRHRDGSWRWVEGTFASLFEDPEVGGLLATVRDVTERKRAEESLHASEKRQAYLLKLSDALRPLVDPIAVQETASRLLGEHLGAGRVLYGQISADGEYALVERDYHREDMGSGAGRYRLVDFGPSIIEELRNGRTFTVGDVESQPGLTDAERDAYRAWGVLAAAAVPLIKAGRYVAFICLHSDVPREWPENEIALIEETAKSTWAAVERVRAEEALRTSEEKYRTLFASIDEGFCIIKVISDGRGEAVDYRFLETNPAFERQTGLINAVGKTMRELAPEHEGFWFEVYGRVARTGEATRFEHEAAALGRYYDVYAFRISEPGEDRVAIIFNDILPRKRAEEERERLRALEASVRAEAAERERISRELHDRVAHTMAVAHQSLELHAALVQSAPEKAAEKLKLARQNTRTALDHTRDLSAQLARRQTEETREGLASALRDLLETHLPGGVESDLSATGDETAIPPPVREQAYLVMREAVRNAVAHSGCQRVGVSVEVDGGELRGRVEDDGEGFDPRQDQGGENNDRENGEPTARVGLRSMRERTEMLGGRLEVSSKPGRGTAVEVRVPLAD